MATASRRRATVEILQRRRRVDGDDVTPSGDKPLPLLPAEGGRERFGLAILDFGLGAAASPCCSPSSPGGRGGGWEKRAGVMRAPTARRRSSDKENSREKEKRG